MDKDEILLEELASTYEQLNIFYNWYERIFSGVTSKSKLRDALVNVVRATDSISAIMASIGRGEKLSILSSWSSSPQVEKKVLDIIREKIPEIEGRLSVEHKLSMSVDYDNGTLHLLFIPWKKRQVLQGVFAYAKKISPYKSNEQILLRNSSIQLGILTDSSILSSSLDRNNHELSKLLTSNITEFNSIFNLLNESINKRSILSNIPLAKGTSVNAILSDGWKIIDCSERGNIGKSVFDVFQEEVYSIIESQEDYINSLPDGRLLTSKPVVFDNIHFGTSLVITPKNAESSLSRNLSDVCITIISDSYARMKTEDSLSNIYTSHLISVSRLVDSMHPVLSRRLSNMNLVLSQLCKALKLSSEDIKTLMLSAKLIDVSLIYLDYETLQRYLVHGTSTLNSGILKDVHDHPLRTAELLEHQPELSDCAEIVATHHERWDGLGYPKGLKGEQIPRLSRILHLAQSLSYRTENYFTNALDMLRIDTEVNWLQRQSGRAFDPKVVEALLDWLDIQKKDSKNL
jgi:response regulator RpfG family c-di-GMP phosphodiesterase